MIGGNRQFLFIDGWNVWHGWCRRGLAKSWKWIVIFRYVVIIGKKYLPELSGKYGDWKQICDSASKKWKEINLRINNLPQEILSSDIIQKVLSIDWKHTKINWQLTKIFSCNKFTMSSTDEYTFFTWIQLQKFARSKQRPFSVEQIPIGRAWWNERSSYTSPAKRYKIRSPSTQIDLS